MKLRLFALLMLSNFCSFGVVLNSLHSNNAKVFSQDRKEIAFNNMVNELRNLHGELFNLPYDQQYIQSKIIPEVNAKRAEIAPHYPLRQNYGSDSNEAYSQLRIWFETYPAEHANYVAYLKEFIALHSK